MLGEYSGASGRFQVAELRLKASVVGLDADEYRNEQVSDGSWSGFRELVVDAAAFVPTEIAMKTPTRGAYPVL